MMTPAGDIFTKSNNFVPVLHELSKRKLFLAFGGDGEEIDSKAKDNDVDLLKIDMVLDETKTTENLDAQLANVETMTLKSGFTVVVIKNPSSEALETISKWAAGLNAKHIRLVSANK